MSLIDGFARLRLTPARTAILFCVVIGLGISCAGRSARADQDVDLKMKASPQLMAFARHFFLHEWEDRNIFIYGDSREHHPARLVDKTIKKGEADLNDDGVPERFFIFTGLDDCGTAGCEMLIVQKRGKKWQVIMDESGEYIRILNQTDFGYHRICTPFVWKWNGARYDLVLARPHNEDDVKDEFFDAMRCDPNGKVVGPDEYPNHITVH